MGCNICCLLSKLPIRITWVDQYGLLIKYFQKDYTDWNPFTFHHNFLKRQCGLNRISFYQNITKRQRRFSHIVFCSKFSKKTMWVELYCLLVKNFLKDYMGWTILSFGQKFLKTLYALKKIAQYALKGIAICSKLTYQTIWIEQFDLLIKFYKKTTSTEPHFLFIKISLRDNMGQTVLSFGQNFLKKTIWV